MNQDLISRRAARDALNQLSRDNFSLGDWFQTYLNALIAADDAIQSLPSVQPPRMRGKWIEVNDYYNRISGKCSVCGWESHMYEDDVVGMDFCPNCGSDMRETE